MNTKQTIPDYIQSLSDLATQNFEIIDGLSRSFTSPNDFVQINYNKKIYTLPSILNLYSKITTLENNFKSLVDIDGIGGAGVFINGNNRKIKVCPFECKPVELIFNQLSEKFSIIHNISNNSSTIQEQSAFKLRINLNGVNVQSKRYNVNLSNSLPNGDTQLVYTEVCEKKYDVNRINFNFENIDNDLTKYNYIRISEIQYNVDFVEDTIDESYILKWYNMADEDGATRSCNTSIKIGVYDSNLTTGMILTTADRMASFVITNIADDEMHITSINGAYQLNKTDFLYIKNDISNPYIEVPLLNTKFDTISIASITDESNVIGDYCKPIRLFNLSGETPTVYKESEWASDVNSIKTRESYFESLKNNNISENTLNQYINNELYYIYANNTINELNVKEKYDDILEQNRKDSQDVSILFDNFDFSSNSEIDSIKTNLETITTKIDTLEHKSKLTLLESNTLKQLKQQRTSLMEQMAQAATNASIYTNNYKDCILNIDFNKLDTLLNPGSINKSFANVEVRYKIRNYNDISSDFFYAESKENDIVLKDGNYVHSIASNDYIKLSIIVPKNAYIDLQFRFKYWLSFPNTYGWTDWSDYYTVINNVSTNIDVSAITSEIISTFKTLGIFNHIDNTAEGVHDSTQISTNYLKDSGAVKNIGEVLSEMYGKFGLIHNSELANLGIKDNKGVVLLYSLYDEANKSTLSYMWTAKVENGYIVIPDYKEIGINCSIYIYNPTDIPQSVKWYMTEDHSTENAVTLQDNERVKVSSNSVGKIDPNELKKYPLLVELSNIIIKDI